ncbi:MAG: NDP-sugar synthase [bacterium]
MILAAGFGERLRPVTEKIPKPLLPLLDRPLVDRALDSLAAAGVAEVIINLHHGADLLRERLGTRRRGVNLHYSFEPVIMGPVGAIKKAEGFFEGRTFIVVNGDVLTDLDPAQIVDAHRRSGAALTLAVVPPPPGMEALAAIAYDGGSIVRSVWGEPAGGLSLGVNAGVYVYEPRVLEHVPPGAFFGFAPDLTSALFSAGEKIAAFVHGGYWNDLGTPDRYLQAHRDVLENRAHLPPDEGLTVRGGSVHRGESRVAPGATVRPPCYFGEGCDVESGAEIGPFAVLGAGCRVGTGARAADAVVFPGVNLPPGSSFVGTIVHETPVFPGTQ